MRRCLAVALILTGASLPLCAQRGGGARGGFSAHSGGFSSHSAATFSRPGPTIFPGRFAATPGRAFAPANHPGYPRGAFTGARSYNVPATVRLTRPSFYNRSPVSPVRPGRPYRPHRPGSPGYGGVFLDRYPGWLSAGYFDYFDLGFNGLGFDGLGFDNGYCDPDLDNCYAGDSYDGAPGYTDEQAPAYYGNPPSAGSDQDEYDQAGPPPPSPTGPAPYGYAQQPGYAPQPQPQYFYPQPSAAAGPPQSPLTQSSGDQETITLIFKDGRPAEQIRNYALTRTTLYVLRGSHRQDIPVDQLDLAATEKANRDAGVDFQLPHSPHPRTAQPAAPAAQ